MKKHCCWRPDWQQDREYPQPESTFLPCIAATATRLKRLAIFPRKVNFSCFGYHPYLESRLTIQEKWVLPCPGRAVYRRAAQLQCRAGNRPGRRAAARQRANRKSIKRKHIDMSAKLDLDHLRQWIGKTDSATDLVTPQLARG